MQSGPSGKGNNPLSWCHVDDNSPTILGSTQHFSKGTCSRWYPWQRWLAWDAAAGQRQSLLVGHGAYRRFCSQWYHPKATSSAGSGQDCGNAPPTIRTQNLSGYRANRRVFHSIISIYCTKRRPIYSRPTPLWFGASATDVLVHELLGSPSQPSDAKGKRATRFDGDDSGPAAPSFLVFGMLLHRARRHMLHLPSRTSPSQPACRHCLALKEIRSRLCNFSPYQSTNRLPPKLRDSNLKWNHRFPAFFFPPLFVSCICHLLGLPLGLFIQSLLWILRHLDQSLPDIQPIRSPATSKSCGCGCVFPVPKILTSFQSFIFMDCLMMIVNAKSIWYRYTWIWGMTCTQQ